MTPSSSAKENLILGLQETLNRLEQNQFNYQKCKQFALELQAYETMAAIRYLEISTLKESKRLQEILKSLAK